MRVLIVDDEKRLAQSLSNFLKPEGIEASLAFDGLSARRLLEEEPFDAVVTDLRMPGMDGIALLRWIREEGPAIPAIMISAHGEVRDAVSAMKLGAWDYLVKPFDPDELLIKLNKAVSERQAFSLLAAGRQASRGSDSLVGESQGMRDVKRLVEKAAPSPATVLITGESGTGKEVVARMIHNLSGKSGAFVPVNMGALPEHLMESELFGYEKGAFTGADSRKIGLFETAHGGTLFLDEIGEMPAYLQIKLLRAIQEKKVQRLGALKGIPFDSRLVAATNRNLEAEVRSGRFREDLYYRLNVIRVSLPPLRERKGDIPLLAGYLLSKLSTSLGRKIEGLSAEALGLLEAHDFPGNVRELENAIERAVILADSAVLQGRDFQFFRPQTAEGENQSAVGIPRSLAEIEKEAIESSLRRNAYHRERTAEELGITRRTLLNKINEYDLSVPGH